MPETEESGSISRENSEHTSEQSTRLATDKSASPAHEWRRFYVTMGAILAISAVMWFAIPSLESTAESASEETHKLAAEHATLISTIEERTALIPIFESQTQAAEAWLSTLEENVADEMRKKDAWRDVAQALNACNKARKKIAEDVRAGKSTSSAEAAANRTCTTALRNYNKLGNSS